MKMELAQHIKQQMQLGLAPQIIQSIEILQMPLLDLQQEIKNQLIENPMLEEVQEEPDTPEAAAKEDGADTREEMDPNWSEHFRETVYSRRSMSDNDGEVEMMQNTAARPVSLQDYLFNQFMLLPLGEVEYEIGEQIIYNIDDDGYLHYDLFDLAQSIGPEITAQQVEDTLKVVQTLDPLGVGARDLKECLLIQLGDKETRAYERLLVGNYLEDIEKNRLPKIARETGRDIEDVKQAVQVICSLDPRPGRLFSQDQLQPIVPDIVVENVEGKYVLRMEDRYIPQLMISQQYAALANDSSGDKATRDFVRKKIEAARWLISAIQQRKQTLTRVANAIVDYQKDFLEKGLEYLRPLKMQMIADELGIHVSTVSRAIFNKYMQTPRGIFPLKFFFTGGMTTSGADDVSTMSESGGELSTLTVKQKVRDLIENEDKNNPYSDDEVVKILREQGLDIARRTVTKYRKALNIPSSRQRRTY